MEKLLTDFINTLDASLRKFQSDSIGAASSLTIAQLRYLDAVHALGEPTITQIADKLKVAKASVTAGINKLAAAGFVTKEQSSDDKRVFHVRLTEASLELVKVRENAINAYEAFLRSALSREELREFERIITKLVRFFESNGLTSRS